MIEEKYSISKEWEILKKNIEVMNYFAFDFFDRLLRKLYTSEERRKFFETQRFIRRCT